MHQRGIVIAAAILIAISGFWAHQHGAQATVPHVPQAVIEGTPYAIAVNKLGAALDLNILRNERYLLIVGSLGATDVEHSIDLTAQPISTAAPLRGSPVRPLHVSPPPPLILPDAPAPTIAAVGNIESRDFFIHVTDGALDDPRGYQCIRSKLIAEGQHVRVYLDGDQTEHELYPGVAAELIRLFDNQVYPVSLEHYGRYLDIDGDGKFAILLSHWLGKLQGGRTSVGGFVRGSDFSPKIVPPFGNQADVLYLNSNTATGPQLKTLLAHEYAHAVLFSERRRLAPTTDTAIDEEDWLHEAIAHIAENRQSSDWSNLDHRIHAFLQNPARSPLAVADYYRAGRWRDHGCRGATYLFLRWCADTYGEGIIRRLIHSRQRGRANLEQATGQLFEELFRHWTIALAQPRGRFRFLSLDDRIGSYDLHGVAHDQWDVGDAAAELRLCGTACRFVEITAKHSPGLFRISVSGRPASGMQLTLIKLSNDARALDRPRPQLAAR